MAILMSVEQIFKEVKGKNKTKDKQTKIVNLEFLTQQKFLLKPKDK